MLTVSQCRAARGLLGWSAQDLADRGGFGVATVRRFEAGQTVNVASIQKIEATLQHAGVTLVAAGDASPNGGEGVRLAPIQSE
ncbi:helix-turn-helix domain-containing protein [Sphingomonas aerophila]|uniref:helix-turn-helix domain-containing protein n=1 Tax=Sphingomonas aerophila TaxID=1344948 RepID=UPI00160A65C6|nr:helix-turn-helix domain-containing protein [Sphingomonas aerophila]